VSLFDLGPAPFYVPRTDRRDEMVDPSGAIRPVWERVHSTLLGSGVGALRRDAARIQRRLHSHGAAFEMTSGDHRGWRLDPVPMVVERAEWAGLGRALVQRARVLEAILADVFGEQRLLRSGLLPIDAIVSHRDYLRPCIGVPPGGGRHLVLHAADVARLPDGSFSVISDRTQAPSGAGYTLENREVLSTTYPELVRTSGVEPLRPWFSALRLTLAEVAPPGVDDPRIVILTPGPLSETYFEHGFLSRALGYTLVEPADLTVRDGHVWLKSVTGLEPVHVILRRQDAEWCDSLELRSDSLLGVPGLVEAARRRNVSIVNPLGSGLTENPALLPYLGAVTRALLDEDPLVESAPTWWCGDPAGRSHVLAHLDHLVIKPVNRVGAQSTFGRPDRAQRQELAARIDRRTSTSSGGADADHRARVGTGHDRAPLRSAAGVPRGRVRRFRVDGRRAHPHRGPPGAGHDDRRRHQQGHLGGGPAVGALVGRPSSGGAPPGRPARLGDGQLRRVHVLDRAQPGAGRDGHPGGALDRPGARAVAGAARRGRRRMAARDGRRGRGADARRGFPGARPAHPARRRGGAAG
jgi:uncharacterized circularly permuted ATP-grasp superfamily protein